MGTIGIALAVFFAVMLLAYLIIGGLTNRKGVQTRERLRRYTASAQQTGAVKEGAPGDQLPTVSSFLSSKGLTERMMLEITRAGLKWRPSEFAVMSAAFAIIPVVVLIVMRISLLLSLLGLLCGLLPHIYLKTRQQIRLAAFNAQISDTLTLMASSLRSGYSFMRAMQVVASEMPAPIAEEFTRVLDECNVGVPTEEALRRLVERTNSYDMDLVVTAVTIQIQLGGNLAEILDTIAETIRERVRINAEMRALTADGKLSGIILVALPIVLGGVILALNPAYMRTLIDEQTGRIMLIVGGVFMVVGSIVIHRMLRIDF
jgi:tight adherence protein B